MHLQSDMTGKGQKRFLELQCVKNDFHFKIESIFIRYPTLKCWAV